MKNQILEKTDNNYPEFLFDLHQWISLVDKVFCSIRDLIFIYTTVYNLKPKNVLEIGRFHGASTLTICGALSNNGVGHLWSVDINDFVADIVKDKIKDHSTLVVRDSKKIWNFLDLQRDYDICFIDDDHSTSGTLNDLNFCNKNSTSDQMILVHDCDFVEVHNAIDIFLTQNSQYVNCGVWGERIQVLRKMKNST